MSIGSVYQIMAYWGPGQETAAQCGVRFCRMLDTLAPVDPLFSDWKFYGATRIWPMPSTADDELTRLIAECVVRADDGDPVPIYGYRFSAAARPSSDTSLLVSVHAGCYAPMMSLVNTVDIKTKPLNAANAAFITTPIFTSALLAMARAWDATWCAAYPWDIIPLWPKPGPGQPHFRMAWITYLSPCFAPLVTPPRSAIIDHTVEGGLVMTATRDRFDVGNPTHLAVAREIDAAMAPVSALPWPSDVTPES
jgi:immunity protein 52 of polymorphic toxin system